MNEPEIASSDNAAMGPTVAHRMRRLALRTVLVVLSLLALAIAVPTSYVMLILHSPPAEVAVGRKSIWCNQRYLPNLDASVVVIDRLHQTVALNGYLYATLGAYVLQKANTEAQTHFFELPARARVAPRLHRRNVTSGFEANSFEIMDRVNPSHLREIVVVFTGSDEAVDWRANFSLNANQYDEARAYVQTVRSQYPLVPIAVTGYSLGGALAVHVTKHPVTAGLIYAAWVFNPSPKIWADSSINAKIWLAATSNDILKIAHLPLFRFLPGVSAIGAPANQRAENFYLIESNPVHAHFRWALARNMLHSADLALWKAADGDLATSEPLEILQQSRFSACPK
jgi:dienelactone hydrolase